MTYQFIENLNPDEHDALVAKHPLGSISQFSKWASVKDDWQHEYVGLKQDGILVGSAQCLIRKEAMGLSIVYIPRGPILDYENQELVEVFFNHLKMHFKKWGTIMVKFDPLLTIKKDSFESYKYEPHLHYPLIDTLKALGIKHLGFDRGLYTFAQPRYVTQLDKIHYEATGYTNNAQRNIKGAMRRGVEIERIKLDEIERFGQIIRYTEKRKNIGLRNVEYFKKIMKAFDKDSLVLMAYLDQEAILSEMLVREVALLKKIASMKDGSPKQKTQIDQLNSTQDEIKRLKENMERDGKRVDIAGLLAIITPQKLELLYMGLNETYRRYYAPHLLYDYAIQWGFDQGVETIDFGGMEGSLEDGLSQFKASFNGQVIEYMGEFDLVLNPILYQAYKIGWPILKKIKFMIKIKENQA